MSIQPDDFDLDAAWIRRAQGDIKAFMEALAVRLYAALPGRVEVERRKDGLFSKASHVARVTIRCDKAVYSLAAGPGGTQASRAKLVRGITLSTTDIPISDWIGEVRAEVKALAGDLGAASEDLHDFL